MAAASPQSIFPDSYVGFDSITKQIEKKSVKRGFQFNVICVGRPLPVPCASADS
jgi:septin 3/9/12